MPTHSYKGIKNASIFFDAFIFLKAISENTFTH